MTAPELSARERDVVARFEAGEAAPESFDATAAVRRVMTVVDDLDREAREVDWLVARSAAADRVRGAVNGWHA